MCVVYYMTAALVRGVSGFLDGVHNHRLVSAACHRLKAGNVVSSRQL